MRRLRPFIQSKCILSDGPLRADLALRLPDLFYEPAYQRKFLHAAHTANQLTAGQADQEPFDRALRTSGEMQS
jgi:hypothetical protein